MLFKTIKERLLIMTKQTKVSIFCVMYDTVLYADTVENLERYLPQALLDTKINAITTRKQNGYVTFYVD